LNWYSIACEKKELKIVRHCLSIEKQ
jgi:hypothetical protein